MFQTLDLFETRKAKDWFLMKRVLKGKEVLGSQQGKNNTNRIGIILILRTHKSYMRKKRINTSLIC